MKILKILKRILSALCVAALFSVLASCQSDSGSGDGSPDDSTPAPTSKEKELLEHQVALYKTLCGSYEDIGYGSNQLIQTLVLAEDSITVDGKRYPFNPEADIDVTFKLNDEYYKNTIFIKLDNILYYFCAYQGKAADLEFEDWYKTKGSLLNRVSSAGGSDKPVAADFAGEYSYAAETSMEFSGKITLSEDGKWTYSGGKTNAAATSGTYTADGSKLTMKWFSAVDVSETFTVAVDDGSAVWKSENEYTSTFFTMLFGVETSKKELSFTFEKL